MQRFSAIADIAHLVRLYYISTDVYRNFGRDSLGRNPVECLPDWGRI